MIRIDREGYVLIAVLGALAVLSVAIYGRTRLVPAAVAGIVFALCAAVAANFFRDPERVPPGDDRSAVSSADGRVIGVSEVEAAGFDGGRALRIAVFMHAFNVHVNRAPLAGTVTRTEHRNGRKLPAFNIRAEYENEMGDTDFETSFGPVRVRQIAGLLARRVVMRTVAGDTLGRGERIGLIRLGSRVDVFLPRSFMPSVEVGDTVVAGETVIARHA